ncbi:hypothetical protein SU69_05555 [Thermosipho melanesiensis]|uniref:Uncharacterized protein n=2 Tax=Thermosipho melanesiensis TaxID=46541 RepID=A6LLZ8_THEM4|nr:hypothetical protein [Thermosipho melanesiensis]ABR30949.1 hypothetical protein Tmel_1089 [Thermosipho melanesiensis BI429]APT74875.1 hypothetical protein BW47_05820 [Thermosipho melanesiensis]OOC35991.1 hypothetical protein SU68_05615 [Thermosipho melanesiensis]OOC38130.1 hypothetical protein SU69_05555 [Thermosipho melanesiensis]OOC38259.1 hypothetical protein SU70_05565 [Thermosipho melanesiensis]
MNTITSKTYNKIIDIIKNNVNMVIDEISELENILENLPKNKVVCINNSFFYRKDFVKTSKNSKYLCFSKEDNKVKVFIGKLQNDIKKDWVAFDSKQISKIDLELAVRRELKVIGDIVFILIGNLEEVSSEVELEFRKAKRLKYDPSIKEEIYIEEIDKKGNFNCIVNSLVYSERLLENIGREILKALNEEFNEDNKKNIRNKVTKAFDKLVKKAHIKLVLPGSREDSDFSNSLISKMILSFESQLQKYENSLNKYFYSKKKEEKERGLIELLRLSYSFADDSIKLLKLLVTITDLKPLILWCTLFDFYKLKEEFSKIPFILKGNQKKPSLKDYREIVASVRNFAFHRFFLIDKPIEADLTNIKLNAKRLRFFGYHSGNKKTTRNLEYQDQEIVEALQEFTTTTKSDISDDFWEKNLNIMKSMENLLKSMEEILWVVFEMRYQISEN